MSRTLAMPHQGRVDAPSAPVVSTPTTAQILARGLGWFSLALGAAELLAPGALARGLGMRQRGLLAAYGAREVAAGVGILSGSGTAAWLWGRVAGDALDIGTLLAAGRDNPRRQNVGLALLAVAGVTVLDVMCATALSVPERPAAPGPRDYSDRRGMPRPPEEMRGAARDFEVPADMRIPEPLRPWTNEA